MRQLWDFLRLFLVCGEDRFRHQVGFELLSRTIALRDFELFQIFVLAAAAPAAHQCEPIHEVEHSGGLYLRWRVAGQASGAFNQAGRGLFRRGDSSTLLLL